VGQGPVEGSRSAKTRGKEPRPGRCRWSVDASFARRATAKAGRFSGNYSWNNPGRGCNRSSGELWDSGAGNRHNRFHCHTTRTTGAARRLLGERRDRGTRQGTGSLIGGLPDLSQGRSSEGNPVRSTTTKPGWNPPVAPAVHV